MKYIVAVSGGVDSVVLLEMLAKENEHELIVAHFDHGIRDDSADDARFVEAVSKKYELAFEAKREELGQHASEELARERRYNFLNELAAKHNARIVTAHHQDDLIETIAINVLRGTGWRGLAVFGNTNISRPLLTYTKSQLYDYALTHGLEWVEDSTNQTTQYLRNKIRWQLAQLNTAVIPNLVQLWVTQSKLRNEIDDTADTVLVGQNTSRYFFTMIPDDVAVELLRNLLLIQKISLPRPQRQRLLLAIKTAQAGSEYQPGGRCRVVFTRREFIVKPLE